MGSALNFLSLSKSEPFKRNLQCLRNSDDMGQLKIRFGIEFRDMADVIGIAELPGDELGKNSGNQNLSLE